MGQAGLIVTMTEGARYERILSLDGGGTWALLQVQALRRIFGPDARGHRILDGFDLVVANSGGSIVAGALACDMPLAKIESLFRDKKSREFIFEAKLPAAIGRRLPLPRYPTHKKYDALREHLGSDAEIALGKLRSKYPNLPHLVIVGFDYDTNRAAFFRSDKTSASASDASAAPYDATLLDAVHASTNAPVLYFDRPTNMPPPDGRRRFWDGAIGGHNNPALAGVVEALANGAAPERVRVLSLGTGTVRKPRAPDVEPYDRDLFAVSDGGLLGDFKKLAGAVLDDPPDAASFIAHVVLRGRLPAKEPVRDGPFIRMSPVIRPTRSGKAWKWGSPFDDRTWRSLCALDMDAIEQDDVDLIHRLGEAWLDDRVANQPIRADGNLEAEIGHDLFSAAHKAWVGAQGEPASTRLFT